VGITAKYAAPSGSADSGEQPFGAGVGRAATGYWKNLSVADVDDLLPALLDACPSATSAWEAHLAYWAGEDAGGPYIDVSIIARHAVDLSEAGRTVELRALFSGIEDLYAGELTPEAHEVMTVGLLEGIQNITMHDHVPVNSSDFLDYLGPLTHLEWLRLHAMWGTTDS
jgi:hypothetical protein